MATFKGLKFQHLHAHRERGRERVGEWGRGRQRKSCGAYRNFISFHLAFFCSAALLLGCSRVLRAFVIYVLEFFPKGFSIFLFFLPFFFFCCFVLMKCPLMLIFVANYRASILKFEYMSHFLAFSYAFGRDCVKWAGGWVVVGVSFCHNDK